MKDYKGTELHFKESEYNYATAMLSKMTKKVNEAAAAYESLDDTFIFTQAVFKDMLQNGIRNIHSRYSAKIAEQVDQFKFTSPAIVNKLKGSIDPDITYLAKTVEALQAEQDTSHPLYQRVSFSHISVIDRKAVVTDESKAALKASLTITVNNDFQNELYSMLVDMKTSYEALTAYLKKHNCNLQLFGPIIGNMMNSMCYEDKGKLIINSEAINVNFPKP